MRKATQEPVLLPVVQDVGVELLATVFEELGPGRDAGEAKQQVVERHVASVRRSSGAIGS